MLKGNDKQTLFLEATKISMFKTCEVVIQIDFFLNVLLHHWKYDLDLKQFSLAGALANGGHMCMQEKIGTDL